MFRVVDGKAQRVKVRLGVRRGAQVESRAKAWRPGDLVVTAGQLKLRDGAPVCAVGEAAGRCGAAGDRRDAPWHDMTLVHR